MTYPEFIQELINRFGEDQGGADFKQKTRSDD